MTTNRQAYRTHSWLRSFIRAYAVSVALAASGAAYSAEPPEDSGSGSPLSRFHAFKNHASEVVIRALGMIGIQYKYGGDGPENGLDCSGLVRYLFREAWGKDLPRTSEEISRVGQHVEKNELQPGDLVFYNTLRRSFSHVGIYLGDNKFIHSPSAGGQIRIESMNVSYWKKRFNGARRINEPAQQ
jgi:cell wall-associated NlpC family hydrolase